MSEKKVCRWTPVDNEWESYWDTECNESFTFDVDGPTENRMHFCCFCGGHLKVVRVRKD